MSKPSAILPVVLTVLAIGGAVRAQQPDVGTDEQRAGGAKLYAKYCIQCHGEKGDGQGVAAARLSPRPRDFTAAKFKIRTTPSGALPTTQDLEHVIRHGMPYTSMPAWPDFTDAEVAELAYYVKSFSPEFSKPDRVPQPIDIPSPPSASDESAKAGRQIYTELGCAGCHGDRGRGNGTSAPTLKDDWGHHIFPADLSKRWTFVGGPTRQDIFRAFSTGLNGTPMPSYADALPEDKRWQLVDYIHTLGEGDDPGYATLVLARKIEQPIDLDRASELFEDAKPAYFPVVGQVMQPGREFHPSCDGIRVRAVHNPTEIAFELTWHDMRAETSGHNAPNLEVPTFENDPYGGAAAAPGGSESQGEESFWGDEAAGDTGDQSGGGGGFWEEETEVPAQAPDQEFSDAVAVQFPVSGRHGSYFIFGDAEHPVDLWFMDLARKQPAWWVGHGSDQLESQGVGDLSAVARYDDGEWTVIFKRPLRSAGGVRFEDADFVPVAFSVWDGFNRERGNKRGLTQWFYVYVEPAARRSAVGPMLEAAGAVVGIELVLIVWIRRKYTGSMGGPSA